MRLIWWTRARAPAFVILMALVGAVGINGGTASAQTLPGFTLNFSDLNNEPRIPLTETQATATFSVVDGRLIVDLFNTSTPIPGSSGPGPTISNVGFNVNPDLALSLTDAYIVGSNPAGATVSLDHHPILADQ